MTASAFSPLAGVAPVATVPEPGQPETLPIVAIPARTGEVFELIVPLQRQGLPPIEDLIAHEPALHHKADFERITDPGTATISIIAALTGISEDQVGALLPFDSQPIAEWIIGRIQLSLWSPKLDDKGKELPLAEQLRDHPMSLTLQLDHPVTYQTTTMTSLTIKAPTLNSTVGLGKFTTSAEQTAMMISKLADIPYPVAFRLKLVDVARIEAYLAPFYPRGPRTPGSTRAKLAVRAAA
jgi:hypothetical protein